MKTQRTQGKRVKTSGNAVSEKKVQQTLKRIEGLEEKRKAAAGQILGIYAEAKSGGQNIKRIRLLVALRKWIAAQEAEGDARRKQAARWPTVSQTPEART